MLARITHRAFGRSLQANLDSRAVKYMQVRVSRYVGAYRAPSGSSHHAYHSQNPTSSWKVQVTLPLSFCHVLKCPKVIELDIPWCALVVAYLFRALETDTNDSL